MDSKAENFNLKEYLEQIVNDRVKIFKELIRWSDTDYKRFETLLKKLYSPFDKNVESAKEKGERLEELVEFIIQKSYFFKVYRNIHTGTNEIDDVIILSEHGKEAINSFKIARELLQINEDMFIGECKNYESKLGVTYIGKFYGLMVASNMSFGIIFTKEGLTGQEKEYHDSYGLLKVIHLIEKYRNNRDFYIVEFSKKDYEMMANRKADFYQLVETKMINIKTASDYNEMIKQNRHEKEDEISNVIKSYRKDSII